MQPIKLAFLTALFFPAIAFNAQAALYDRGNGLIYDSTQNITWMQDANYASTSPYFTAPMTWGQAKAWADNLTYGGYSDWRLPSAKLVGNNSRSYDGSTDVGNNNTRSEMGHLFAELRNIELYNAAGVAQSGYGLTNSTFVDAATGQNDSFVKIQNYVYWEAEEWAVDPTHAAWSFMFNGGGQTPNPKDFQFHAWAVRDGDVSSVPVPASAWLFGSALFGLVRLARQRKRVTIASR
jgi:hypothetical protein